MGYSKDLNLPNSLHKKPQRNSTLNFDVVHDGEDQLYELGHRRSHSKARSLLPTNLSLTLNYNNCPLKKQNNSTFITTY